MSKAKYTPVVFNNSRGETVSNDPVYRAQQTLAAAGVQSNDDEDITPDSGGAYDGMSGKELKALANERGVDITGLTKVGQVREALEAADAEAESEDDAEDTE